MVLFEHPVVTGELQGSDAKAQVIDLWPRRSGRGRECVATRGTGGTPRQRGPAAPGFLSPQLQELMFLLTRPALINPILMQRLTTDFGYLDLGCLGNKKLDLQGLIYCSLTRKTKSWESMISCSLESSERMSSNTLCGYESTDDR